MARRYYIFFIALITVFIIDQNIKSLFLEGFEWHSKCISLVLALNKGVAFSMFAFLGEYLKYIQMSLIGGIVIYVLYNKDVMKDYYLPLGFLLGGGISNLYDRFVEGAVVDYVYWHCWFDFAIFNFADVMIDIGVVLIIFLSFKKK